MPSARLGIKETRTSSLKDRPRSKGAEFLELPMPSGDKAGDRNQVSRMPGSRRLALRGCACVETEDLPRIILVSSGDGLMASLCRALDPCPLEIRHLQNCGQVAREIGRCTTGQVIFTDVQLPDGDWKQVLGMARQTSARAEMIVASRFVDVPLYLDALEAGAYDFVVPPFRTVELGYIIVNAIYACSKQRTQRFSGSMVAQWRDRPLLRGADIA